MLRRHVRSFEYRSERWRPFAMRSPFLLFLVSCLLAFVLAIERMRARSQTDGALYFDISLRTTFITNYLFTILAILFAIALAKVDLDIKRLEPYFQLSRAQGCPASQSLCLSYANDWLPLVPYKSAKNGHWAVAVSGAATLIVFWGIAPFLGAMFATNQVLLNRNVRVQTHQPVLTNEFAAYYNLNGSFMFTSYASQSLNSSEPQFTTVDLTVLPFERPQMDYALAMAASNITWTINTTAYALEPVCQVPIVSLTTSYVKGFVYNNGTGPWVEIDRGTANQTVQVSTQEGDCTFYLLDYFQKLRSTSANLDKYQIRASASSDYESEADGNLDMTDTLNLTAAGTSLPSNQTCSFFKSLFMVTFGKPSNRSEDYSMALCRERWITKNVVVTLDDDMSVLNVDTSDPGVPLSQDLSYNLGFSLDMLVNGGSRAGDDPLTAPPNPVLNSSINPDWYRSSSITQYIAAAEPDVDTLAHPERLVRATETALRLLGAHYFREIITAFNSTVLETPGARWTGTVQGIVIVNTFARLLQGLCLLVAALILVLIIIFQLRTNQLRSDPASIASLMCLIYDSKHLQAAFHGSDEMRRHQLNLLISSGDYRLGNCPDGKYRLELFKGGAHPLAVNQPYLGICGTDIPKTFSKITGVFALIGFVSLTSFLIVLFVIAKHTNGLPAFSSGNAVQQIIYSYIPSVVGMIVEPYWTLIVRDLAVVESFRILTQANAFARESLCLEVATLTSPGVWIFSILRRRHFWLGWIAGMAFLANVLAVSLTGLFYSRIVAGHFSVTSTIPYGPLVTQLPTVQINIWATYFAEIGYDTDELYDVARLSNNTLATNQDTLAYLNYANDTVGLRLPAWTKEDVFFLPFLTPEATSSAGYKCSRTTGIRAELTCDLYKPELGWSFYTDYNLNVTFNSSVGYNVQATPDIHCHSEIHPFWGWPGNLNESMEFFPSMISSAAANQTGTGNHTFRQMDNTCRQLVWFTVLRSQWLRENNLTVFEQTISCTPEMYTNDYEVCVDTSGNVLSAQRLNETIDNGLFTGSEGDITKMDLLATFRRQMSIVPNGSILYMHGSVESERDWTITTLVNLLNSTNLINGSAAIPSEDILIPAIQTIYKRFFAWFLGTQYKQIFTDNTALRTVQDSSTTCSIYFSETRYFINTSMFGLSLAILVLYVCTVIAFYGCSSPLPYLPRFPLSPAGVIAYVYGSQKALAAVAGLEDMSSKERHNLLIMKNRTFGYGSFNDGIKNDRWGIEQK